MLGRPSRPVVVILYGRPCQTRICNVLAPFSVLWFLRDILSLQCVLEAGEAKLISQTC